MNHSRFSILSLSVLITPLFLSAPCAADYPQWRGLNRDGHVVGANIPDHLPPSLGAPKWKVEIGDGYSSPVVANGKVFIQGREGGKNETCLCFDAITGKPIWKHVYPSTFEPPDPTAGKGPGSTPTVDRDRVYMLGLGGMFNCFDASSGRVLWKHDFAKEYWGVEKDKLEGDAWMPACGACSSALVVGDEVIVSVGGKKAGSVVAFNRNTGKIIWNELPDRSSYASPMKAMIGGVSQFVAFTGLRMVGLHEKTHKLLWEFPFTAMFEQTIVTPVIWKDHVVVCGEAKQTTALSIKSNGDIQSQSVAWTNAELGAYMVTPVIIKDHLFGLDHRSRRLICINMADGKTAWTSTDKIGNMGSILAVGNRILVMGMSGDLYSFEANTEKCVPTGKVKVSEAGAVWSHIALDGSKLYAKDKAHLMCYDFAAMKG